MKRSRRKLRPAVSTRVSRESVLRSRVKSALSLTADSLRNSKIKGGYDGISEASWYDNAWLNFYEAQPLMVQLGWSEQFIASVWENIIFKLGV